jgi:hypothetical protein
MKTHGFQEQKLRAQTKMVYNIIWRQELPPLENNKNRETCPSIKDDQSSVPKKLQTARGGPTTCKVEEQQTSEQP